MPDDHDNHFDFYEAICVGCDSFAPVNDLGLCEDCAGKLERDLIRQRDWDYSAAAYGLNDEQREQLYQQVIRQLGSKLELIAPQQQRRTKRTALKPRPHRSH